MLFDVFANVNSAAVTDLISNIEPWESRDLGKAGNERRIHSIQSGFESSCQKHFPACANNEKLKMQLFGAICDIDTLLPFELVQCVQGFVEDRALSKKGIWVKLSNEFDSFVNERNWVKQCKEDVDTLFSRFATASSKDAVSSLIEDIYSFASLNYNKKEDNDRINVIRDSINISCNTYFPYIAQEVDRNQV